LSTYARLTRPSCFLRLVLPFARKILVFGFTRALEATILNKLAKPDRAIVHELAQRHLPGLEPAAASA